MFKSFTAKVIGICLAVFFWIPALTFDLRLMSQPSDVDVYLGAAGLIVLLLFAAFVVYMTFRVVETYLQVKKEK